MLYDDDDIEEFEEWYTWNNQTNEMYPLYIRKKVLQNCFQEFEEERYIQETYPPITKGEIIFGLCAFNQWYKQL